MSFLHRQCAVVRELLNGHIRHLQGANQALAQKLEASEAAYRALVEQTLSARQTPQHLAMDIFEDIAHEKGAMEFLSPTLGDEDRESVSHAA